MPVEPRSYSHPFASRKRQWQRRLNEKLGLDRTPVVRKVVYSIVGVTVLIIGIVMIVLPGPSVIVIPLGLAILASEYAWARRVLRRGKGFIGRRLQRRKAAPTVL
ncbi:MAG: PGPGW domain-containing protein [Chthoniobacterales bacterium]